MQGVQQCVDYTPLPCSEFEPEYTALKDCYKDAGCCDVWNNALPANKLSLPTEQQECNLPSCPGDNSGDGSGSGDGSDSDSDGSGSGSSTIAPIEVTSELTGVSVDAFTTALERKFEEAMEALLDLEPGDVEITKVEALTTRRADGDGVKVTWEISNIASAEEAKTLAETVSSTKGQEDALAALKQVEGLEELTGVASVSTASDQEPSSSARSLLCPSSLAAGLAAAAAATVVQVYREVPI
eukprot:CAMPEP_0181338178 /NCGR_PEP_ID=MMETSP1101-20121128/28494_1 /TAXON_ID=46948 /ORGANISM="Rhodomonas abbreviata, Strain Caron Lab Isolate" /LENGTH=240 /DNA_ID=CAMNT_0023448883 /DNA_START=341 /DNA_END=1063 /DNA_ORIENTATION=+